MKITYLCYFSLEDTNFIGVRKKIYAQVKAFEKLGNQCRAMYCHNGNIKYKNLEIPSPKGITNYRRSVYKNFKKEKILLDTDVVYIRFPGTVDYFLNKTCKFLNKKGIKVILEIPTYPLDGEYKELLTQFKVKKQYGRYLKTKINVILSKIFSKFLYKTNCKIVTYMNNKEIWKIKPIIIDNGIDTEEIGKITKEKTDIFNIVVVANLAKWHGVDRVIIGIKKYIENNKDKQLKIKLNIVGKGDVEEKLKELVNKNSLNDYIEFHGFKDGKELDNIYKNANIAIGSLGLHRIGLNEGSTLKIKEYCALGIPFILSYKEREIDKDFKYALQIPANENPVNIEECIEFYKNLQKFDYRNEMNEFAKEKFDWKNQMEKVLKNIERE